MAKSSLDSDNNKCKIIHKKDCARVLVLSAIQSEMVMVEVINASSCYTEPGQSWRIRAIIKFAP